MLTYFITNRCNARCAHCFYWQQLGSETKELSLEQVARIAHSLDHPVDLVLTGGEPTLRDDMLDICRIFHQANNCRTIGIATNGLLPERLLRFCEAVLGELQLDSLSVQVSLDGPESIHDAIRGVPGGYRKAIASLDGLRDLRKADARLHIYAALAIQHHNIEHIAEFIDEMHARQIPHRFVLVRGNSYGTYGLPEEASSGIDPMDHQSAEIPLHQLNAVMEDIRRFEERGDPSLWPLGDRLINDTALRILNTGKRVVPCYAGRLEAVLYPDGNVALCELSRPVGNLRDYDWDFAKLWSAPSTEQMRSHISKCYCIHSCAIGTGLSYDAAGFNSIRISGSRAQ
jgi:MoaA/NifB/PqqE/SkfB family radical SAM enzyme